MALDTVVVRFRVRALPEANQRIGKERAPANEQHKHQPVDNDDNAIDFAGVRRGLQRQSE